MKRRLIAITVATLALVLVLGYASRDRTAARPRFPSSLAGEPEGLMGFRLLLDDLEIPTEVLRRPWDDLAAGDATGLLVIAQPIQRSPDPIELVALRNWIERGGALLVLDDATMLERDDVLEGLLSSAGVAARSPLGELDPLTLRPARPATRAAHGTSARPSDTSFDEILLNQTGELLTTSSAVPLALDDDGRVTAAEGRLGQGRVIRVLGALAANDRLALADNLDFAINVVEHLRAGGAVWFDEFHQGFGGALPVRRLDGRALAWALAQTLLATIAFALARGIRFGPIRPEPAVQRRSSLEYVHSMASLYHRAGARSHVVQQGLERFVREARSRWHVDEKISNAGLARIVGGRCGTPTERIEQVLARAEAATVSGGRPDERTMVRLVGDLARLEQEVFGDHRTGS